MARLRNMGEMARQYMQYYYQNKLNQQSDANITERELNNSRLGMVQKMIEGLGPLLSKGDISLDAIPQEYQREFAPYAAAAPSQQERTGKVIGQWGGAANSGLVPSEPEAMAQLQAAQVNTTPAWDPAHKQQFSGGQDGTLPAYTEGYSMPEPVRQAMAARQAIADRLKGHEDATNLTRQNWVDVNGVMQQQDVPTSQAAAYGARPTERTGAQEGTRELDKLQGSTLSPIYAVAKAQVDNTISTLTRGSTRADAAANAAGQQQGYMEPGFVDARVSEANRKAQGNAQANAQFQVPTDSERRAAGQMQPMVNQHAIMTAYEQQGVGLKAGLQTVGHTPGLANLDQGTMGNYKPDEYKYLQAMDQFINMAGYVISGVQVRKDERDNFVSVFGVNASDPAPLRLQKQNARAAFLAAIQIGAGRSKLDAGQALGRSVRNGSMPVAALNTLQLDPEVQAGVSMILEAGQQ